MSLFQLGIDVAKAKLDCALRLPNGKFRSKVVVNSTAGFAQLTDWLASHQATAVHVCMEATGIYWEEVAEFLAAAGFTVSVVNPAQIKAYGASRLTRSKTDAVDARLIADFCAERQPSPWQPPSAAEIALRALVLRLEALQTMRTQDAIVSMSPARLFMTTFSSTSIGSTTPSSSWLKPLTSTSTSTPISSKNESCSTVHHSIIGDFPMHSRLPLLYGVTLALLLAPSAGHAATTEQKCAIAKLKAAGKRTAAKLVCHQKAIAINSSADPICLRKAEIAFLKTIEQTEKKFQCPGDNLDLANESDACASNLVESTPGGTATGEPQALIGITAAHNAVRADVGVAALAWSASLAATAQAWADKCVDTDANGFIDHNANRGDGQPYYVGENLYGSTQPVKPKDAVSAWTEEASNYDYANNTCTGICGHYTQVVWAATHEIGCGISSCPGLTYRHAIVCDYGPGGNTGGKPY